MERILMYASKYGYTDYTSTLVEAWRLSIAGLTDALVQGLEQTGGEPFEFLPEERYADDPIAAFGLVEARRHRERGTNLAMFLGLLKYYRQSFQDLVSEKVEDAETRDRYQCFILSCFDRFELALSVQWNTTPSDEVVQGLQRANRDLANEKNRYLTLFESLCDPAFLVDDSFGILHFNLAAASLLGVEVKPGGVYYSLAHGDVPVSVDGEELDRLHGCPLGKLLPWLVEPLEDREHWEQSVDRYEVQTGQFGALRWFSVTMTRMLDISGKSAGAVVIATDITTQKAIQELHEINAERLSLALEATSDGVWDWNVKTGEAFFSPRYYTMLGYVPYEFDPSYDAWRNLVHPDDLEEAEALVAEHLKKGLSFRAEFRMRSKDGQWRWIIGRGKVAAVDEAGQPVRMVGTHMDITERKAMDAKILMLASTDSLTGVNNRRNFIHLAGLELIKSRRHGRPLAVLMLDIDHFKRINDAHGHHVGDVTLQECTRVCVNMLRETDVFGRLGGEEFGAVLSETSESRAMQVAERLRQALAETKVTVEDLTLHFEVSIGVAVLTEEDADLEAVLQRADEALYRAKRTGRNRVVSASSLNAAEDS